MFNVKKFKQDFPGISTQAMIDYIILKKRCYKEDLVSAAVKSQLERKKTPNRSNARQSIKFFLRIGFIKKKHEYIEFNTKFIPINQKSKLI